jgi:hypothetical protein
VVKPFTQLRNFFYIQWLASHTTQAWVEWIFVIAWVKQKVFLFYICLMYILNFCDNLEYSLLEYMSFDGCILCVFLIFEGEKFFLFLVAC